MSQVPRASNERPSNLGTRSTAVPVAPIVFECIETGREAAAGTLQNLGLSKARPVAKRSKSTPPASPTPPREELGYPGKLKRIFSPRKSAATSNSPRRRKAAASGEHTRTPSEVTASELKLLMDREALWAENLELKENIHRLEQQLRLALIELADIKAKHAGEPGPSRVTSSERETEKDPAVLEVKQPISVDTPVKRTRELSQRQRCRSMKLTARPRQSHLETTLVPSMANQQTATKPAIARTRSSPNISPSVGRKSTDPEQPTPQTSTASSRPLPTLRDVLERKIEEERTAVADIDQHLKTLLQAKGATAVPPLDHKV